MGAVRAVARVDVGFCAILSFEHAAYVFRTEGQALNFIRSRIAKGTVVNADESANWNELHSRFEIKRISHEEAYSLDGACTNWAGEVFSRMRRAEIGHHHHIAGAYLLRYVK
jgi:hypothetical protein